MQGDVFDRIRERSREVATSAHSVRISTEAIPAYAQEIGSSARGATFYDEAVHFRDSPEDTVAYLVTLDAVNFGSGYFPHLIKRPGSSGYGTIARALTDRFRSHGPLSPEVLSRITAADCARIFGQDLAVPEAADLMGLFARAWNDLGRDLVERGGSFTSFVDAADGSAARLLTLLDHQPLFHDVWSYQGEEIPFYKRAQILASDLALGVGSTRWGCFRDLASLTIFADNLVPHVLRCDGILIYGRDLLAQIEGGGLLPAGCEAEIEIRACALDAVERMVESLRAEGAAVTARELDMALWNRGQSPTYKALARHRTRTTAY
jgi:hypothetical protein